MPLRPLGFNVFGHFSSSVGLGAAARNTAALLSESPYAFSVTDYPIEGHELGHPHGFEAAERPAYRGMPFGVNVFHMEPNILDGRLRREWALLPTGRRLNALVPFWELSRLPRPWVDPLRAVDFVLAPSLHIKTVFEADAPNTAVIHYPQTVSVPGDITPDRARWSLPESDVVFLTSFDALSDVARKNPVGSIEAFQRAFGLADHAMLVVHMKNAHRDSRYAEEVRRVQAFARSDARIRLIERTLDRDDLLSLYASVDVLVSLHRAEGLGLVLMECMALGTPVIATGWSGNMDFTDTTNSGLVGYTMVPAQGTMDYYRPEYMQIEAEWAEPSVDDAATWMRRLAVDPDLRARLGERARRDIAERSKTAARLSAFDHLASAYHEGLLESPSHRAAVIHIRGARTAALSRAVSSPIRIVRGLRRTISSSRGRES